MLVKRARGDATQRVLRKDYVQSIDGSVGYNVQYSQLVHAANSGCFPWLSGVAPNFERYQIHGIRWIFESTVSDSMGGANPQLGTVLFYFNSDTLDVNPQSKAILMNYAGSKSTKISDSCSFSPAFTGKNQDGELFVPSQDGITIDPTDYYWGRVCIATQGCQTTGAIGDLYVEYDVSLITPKLGVSLGLNLKDCAETWSETFIGAGTNWLYGTRFEHRNQLGVLFGADNEFTFPANSSGAFRFTLTVVGTGVASGWSAPTLTYTNCAEYVTVPPLTGTALVGGSVVPAGGVLGTACERFILQKAIIITDSTREATVAFSAGNRAVDGVTYMSLWITTINPYN